MANNRAIANCIQDFIVNLEACCEFRSLAVVINSEDPQTVPIHLAGEKSVADLLDLAASCIQAAKQCSIEADSTLRQAVAVAQNLDQPP